MEESDKQVIAEFYRGDRKKRIVKGDSPLKGLYRKDEKNDGEDNILMIEIKTESGWKFDGKLGKINNS